jgi:hypothetical protein
MSLCTIADIEAYLGVTLDSADSAVYSDIIDAVTLYVENWTGQSFTDGTYAQRISIADNSFTVDKSIRTIYGLFYGRTPVIEVTCPDTSTSIEINLDDQEIKVFSALSTVSTIDISSITIATLNTTINALPGFTSELQESVNSDLLALTVFEASYGPSPDNSDKLYLYAANEPLSAAKRSNGLYETNITCEEGIIIYQGGIISIPADLNDLAIRMCIKSFNNRNAAISGDVKEEAIGDYSFKLFTAAEQEGLQSIGINYEMVLNKYKVNFDI